MKMLISIAGNICSGKSTVAELLSKKTGIPLFSIDEYRFLFGAYNIARENEAWWNLTNDIRKPERAIFESSGLSARAEKVYQAFDRKIVVLLDADPKTLLRRLSIRRMGSYTPVPFPFRNRSLPDTVWQMGIKLEKLPHDLKYDTASMTPDEIVNEIIKSI